MRKKVFLFAAALFVFTFGFVSAACDNSNYTQGSDWLINSTNSPVICQDMTINLSNNLNVTSGGNLTFNNVTLIFNTTVDKEYILKIDSSNFYAVNSNFSALNQNYQIYVSGYSNFSIDNSSIIGETDASGTLIYVTNSNASINNSIIGAGNVYYPIQFVGALSHVYAENTTFRGANYDLFLNGISRDYAVFRNVTWGESNNRIYINGAHLLCVSCNFPESRVSGFNTYSIYSKNHNSLTNQSLLFGTELITSSNTPSDFLNESDKTIVFYSTGLGYEISSGVSAMFDNVTISDNSVTQNSNYFDVQGTLFVNNSNSSIVNVDLYNSSNVVSESGFYFLHKYSLDIRAQYQGTPVQDVNVSVYNTFGDLVFFNTTDSNGDTDRYDYTVLWVNSTGVTRFNNFTANTTEIGGSNRSEEFNLTYYRLLTVPHDYCDFPTSGDWLINDENKICENRIVTITDGGINISSGFNLTLNNATLNFSLSSGTHYLTVSSGAWFIVNYSNVTKEGTAGASIYISSDYGGNVRYYGSYFSNLVSHVYTAKNDSFYAFNTTFGKLPGYNTVSLRNIQIRSNSTSNSVLMNRSKIYGYISFYSAGGSGNAQVNLLDTDYSGVSDYSLDSNSNSKIVINNTLDLKVLDDNLDNSSSTELNITDYEGNLIYSGTTNSNGNIYGVSLINRIINSTSDITKNYTVSANGKDFGLKMGMPRREYNDRSIVVGTYNQDYEEKLAKVPYLYDFGFTLHDDADTFDYQNGNSTYEGIYNAGFLTSVSQWLVNDSDPAWNRYGFNDTTEELDWFLSLKDQGFELAAHSATETSDYRNKTILLFNNWSQFIGFPMMYIEHSSNEEHIISGSGADPTSDYYLLDLVNTSNVSYYWNYEDVINSYNGKWRTTPENSSTWYNGWKAYEASIDPITGDRWSYGEISLFPNYTNEKAKLPLTDEHGTSINLTSMIGKIHIRDNAHLPSNGLYPLYSSSHIFDLQETKDLTIVYTHSGTFSEFNQTLHEVARYDGYFVPTGVLLDYSTKLEKVSITPGDKSFTVTNNGDSTIEGVVIYPDTNGTIVNITYANITDGRYLLSVGIDKDEMMLPPLSSGESVTVNYDIMGAYDSTIPKVSNVSNGHVELRNAIYNSTAKKTEFGVGLDRITSYNSTNSTPRSTNITIENLDSSKTYTISRDGESWSNYSWSNNTLTIWTFMSTHNFTIQEKSADGASCTYADSCSGGYCNSGVCSSSAPSTSSTTTSSGGSTGGTYKPSLNNFQNGYKVNVVKSVKIDIPFNDKTETINVESVDETLSKVVVSINGQNYEIGLNGNIKIDLDNDGIYDLEISNSNIYKEIATLEFNLISEEVPKEIQEDVGEENIVDSGTENKISFWKKIGNFFSRIWDWVKSYDNSLIVASVAVLVIAVGTGSYFFIRYFRKKGIARFRV